MNLALGLAVQQTVRSGGASFPAATLHYEFDEGVAESVFRLDEPWRGSEWILVMDDLTSGTHETVVLAAVPERHGLEPFRQLARVPGAVSHRQALADIGWAVR